MTSSRAPYRYHCEDLSVLLPYLKKWIVEPIYTLVPKRLSANQLSILGGVCMALALAVVALKVLPHSITYLLAAFFVFGYVVFDHLDGMRARETKTSSALGEFVDHSVDAIVVGMAAALVTLAFAIDSPAFIACILVSMYLAQYLLFVEQYWNKKLFFDAIGTVEANTLFIGTLIFCSNSNAWEAFTQPQFSSYSYAELLFFSGALGGIVTSIVSLKRLEKGHTHALLSSLVFVAMGVLVCTSTQLPLVFLLAALLSANAVDRVLYSHLGQIQLSALWWETGILTVVFLSSFLSPNSASSLLLGLVTIEILRLYRVSVQAKNQL